MLRSATRDAPLIPQRIPKRNMVVSLKQHTNLYQKVSVSLLLNYRQVLNIPAFEYTPTCLTLTLRPFLSHLFCLCYRKKRFFRPRTKIPLLTTVQVCCPKYPPRSHLFRHHFPIDPNRTHPRGNKYRKINATTVVLEMFVHAASLAHRNEGATLTLTKLISETIYASQCRAITTRKGSQTKLTWGGFGIALAPLLEQ